MSKGETRELLQVYRAFAGEVGRNRRMERDVEKAGEVVQEAHLLVAQANVALSDIRAELTIVQNEAAINRSEAQRCKALDVILASERDDADEAALWLEAIALLSEPELVMETYLSGGCHYPVRCLKCGGAKGTGGAMCWPCYEENVAVSQALIRQWVFDGRRDFPRKTL